MELWEGTDIGASKGSVVSVGASGRFPFSFAKWNEALLVLIMLT